MPITRRDLLKKGAALSAITAVGAAVGTVAVAPAARAEMANTWLYDHQYVGYSWESVRPQAYFDGYLTVENWSKEYVYKENTIYKYDQYNFGYPLKSQPFASYGVSSVSILQVFMNRAIDIGFIYPPYLDWDGVFGAQTKAAVLRFQYNAGLSTDGIVGRNTWNKILQKVPY